MIRLTRYDGETVFLSADKITKIGPIKTYTEVFTGGDEAIGVKESPEEVARKVLEWRLAMERYRAAYAEVMRNSTLAGPDLEEAEQDMLKLAGLEEPKDET